MSDPVIQSTVLADGTAIVKDMSNAPNTMTVAVEPAGDATINVWYSLDEGLTYREWPKGEVTAATAEADREVTFYSGITYLKVQRTAGTNATSTFSAC